MQDRVILLDYLHRCDSCEGMYSFDAMHKVVTKIWSLNVVVYKT